MRDPLVAGMRVGIGVQPFTQSVASRWQVLGEIRRDLRSIAWEEPPSPSSETGAGLDWLPAIAGIALK